MYHIQTEDSGIQAPHIITHLFVGGNIIATKKTSYADVLGTHDLEVVVRNMMEEQHKQTLRNLVRGAYNQAIAERVGGATPTTNPELPLEENEFDSNHDTIHDTAPDMPAVSVALLSPQPPVQTTPSIASVQQPVTAKPERSPSGISPAPVDIPLPSPPPASNPFLEVASTFPQAASPPMPPMAMDTPPPSLGSLFGEPESPPVMSAVVETVLPEVEAARLLEEVPVETPASDTIFGEDLMSEKSLDEVILAYLADDLTGGD